MEALGKKIGFTFDAKNFHNISLGQGQEIVAERAMDLAAKEGHWVVLQVTMSEHNFNHSNLSNYFTEFNKLGRCTLKSAKCNI